MPVTESAEVGIVPRDEALAVFGSDQIAGLEPLRPRPLGATVGVWRVRVADRSAVLKLLRLGAGSNVNWAASPEPGHPRWWRRELVVLRDDLVDVLRPELRPPTLLHTADRPDGLAGAVAGRPRAASGVDHRGTGTCRAAFGGCSASRSRSLADGAAPRISPCVDRPSDTAPRRAIRVIARDDPPSARRGPADALPLRLPSGQHLPGRRRYNGYRLGILRLRPDRYGCRCPRI